METLELLQRSAEANASDLLLTVGVPPVLRIEGQMTKMDLGILSPKDCKDLIYSLLNENQIKTICELCDQYAPDVEYYKHNNRLIVKRWLCIKCADEHRVDDNLRETCQSSDARAGRFHRMWGRTGSLK